MNKAYNARVCLEIDLPQPIVRGFWVGEDDQRILWLSYVNTSLLSITLAVWLCSRLAGALLGEQISSGHLVSVDRLVRDSKIPLEPR